MQRRRRRAAAAGLYLRSFDPPIVIARSRARDGKRRGGKSGVKRRYGRVSAPFQFLLRIPDIALGGKHRGLVVVRSEEHTSELQSRRDLVCRLLLAKKKSSWGDGRIA